MGCNCGKNRATAQPRRYSGSNSTRTTSFILVDRDGSSTPFDDRLAADAENARRGYTGIVKPAPGGTS